MIGNLLRFILGVISVTLIQGGEFCPNTFFQCPDYCCGTLRCCSSCSQSVLSHPECVTYYSYSTPGIIGGIVSSIIGFIIILTIILLCCGCICSTRTGIQRRGHIISTQQATVTVVTQMPAAHPQGHHAYPPPSYNYPPAVQGDQYKYPQAPYPTNPPGYNAGYVN